MKQNMGNADRGIRIVLAILFAFLYFTGTVPGVFGLVLVILGAVFLVTSLVSVCPLYSLVGINTCAVKNSSHETAHHGTNHTKPHPHRRSRQHGHH